MKNPATASSNEMNTFTEIVEREGRISWMEGGSVRLRNGTLVKPVVFLGEEDWEDDYNKPRGFKTEDWKYCWNLDGTSVTRPDFDMMEIV